MRYRSIATSEASNRPMEPSDIKMGIEQYMKRQAEKDYAQYAFKINRSHIRRISDPRTYQKRVLLSLFIFDQSQNKVVKII